ILETTIYDVPWFRRFSSDLLHWLAGRGLSATLYKSTDYIPPGYVIAAGPSQRFPGRLHACVAYDGVIVHDPQPSREGLPFGVIDYVVLHGPHGEPMWFNGLRSRRSSVSSPVSSAIDVLDARAPVA